MKKTSNSKQYSNLVWLICANIKEQAQYQSYLNAMYSIVKSKKIEPHTLNKVELWDSPS